MRNYVYEFVPNFSIHIPWGYSSECICLTIDEMLSVFREMYTHPAR